MKKIIYIVCLVIFITSCESRTYEEISDNTPITNGVKYESDLKPIIESSCINCHSASGFKPLNNYNQVKANIDIIINRIQKPNGDPLRMPLGGSLSSNQINLFVKWKTDGLVEK
ncbi:hypothetical protein SAMN05421796_10414 [Chryseobacterium piscicola]|uniref:Cytochrome c domain-containing protein n=1 Tax=Chryseobacterium piscicola TaxID=551459 RepID=A0A1N7M6K5_9FLAO|nr:hypothetical protein [Chryseobacterium piscicola]PQA98236.1 hypothetical protein B0A70_01255 [Chryseobacterium piscicola]SIS81735.1 hypothetical protein SAMN05421796_10414 [Chryseobacterium piscicola]